MILVDGRFGTAKAHASVQRQVTDLLQARGLPVEITALSYGDFAFLGHGPDDTLLSVGVELKTVADFVQAMQTGRLAGHQVPGLLDTYQRVYVVIDGVCRARRGSGLLEVPRGRSWAPLYLGRRPVVWSDVERFIVSLEEAGVRVRRTRTPHETAALIGTVVYPYWQKPYDAHATLGTLYVPTPFALTQDDEATARLRRVLVSLKTGIGYGRSKAVAAHFRSLYGLVTADAAAWRGIPGVGAQTVADTRAAIHATTPEPAATSRVSPRAHAATRRRGDSRGRPHRELGTGTGAERRVRAPRGRRRVPRRRQSE